MNKKMFFSFSVYKIIQILFVSFIAVFPLISKDYLYPTIQITNSIKRYLFEAIIFIILADIAFFIGSILFLRYKTSVIVLAKRIVLAILLCISIFDIIVFSNNILISKTDNVENYGSVDEYLDYIFEVADLKLSDIMSYDYETVEYYRYNYYSEVGSEFFDIEFDVKFTDKSYNEIIQKLSSSTELIMRENNQTGVFTVNPCEHNIVDEWYEFNISYDNETQNIRFILSGCCYT